MQSTLCSELNIITHILIGGIYFWTILTIEFVVKLFLHSSTTGFYRNVKTINIFIKFLIFGIIFYAISSLSSSFIEEEHQIWYYLNNTVLILLCLLETKHILKEKETKSPIYSGNTVKQEHSYKTHQLQWILIYIGHLIARRLNQTGDKWMKVPDIGDWLQMDEHRIWNSLFVSISLILMHLSCMDFGSILTNVLTLTACMLIYYFRTLNGSVYFAGIKASE